MKRLSLALVATLMAYSGYAQTFLRRGNVENVTDYSALAKSSTRGARKVGLLSTAALPCTGSPKIPVVLVQFADTKFMDYDKEGVVNKRYDDYFNLKQEDANNSIGSVYQYFKEQSYGQFTPEFDVMGPVTLGKSYAYYGEDKYANKKLIKDIHISEFYREVCRYVVSNENRNWMDYDNNNDGRVDMIFFIYAGEGENAYDVDDEMYKEKRALIWPKEGLNPLTVNDIVFASYGMTNEIYKNDIDGIGTAVHELSHGLGLPDLYDTSNGPGLGVDAWDVMDGGNYQYFSLAPIGYSAYERDFMGWRQIVTLETDKAYTLTINPLETDGVAYKVVNPENKNEYLILENRQNIGYDKYMPWPGLKSFDEYGGQHGLLITHVDYDHYSWTGNKINVEADHQRYQIVPADGEYLHTQLDIDFDNLKESSDKIKISLMGDLYPGSKNVHEISSYTMFNGGKLNQTIDNIREKDGIIYVDINGGTVIPALQQQLKDDLIAAGEYVSKKMGKKEADALSAAITAAENVARDQDAIEKCIADLKDAVTDAKTSIELYEKVAGYIADVDELGEAAKESFMDVRTNYEDGEITSIEDVDKAYAEAVAAQEAANAIDIVTQDVEGQSIYTLDGKLVKSPVKGINIIKTVNGTSKKVVKKP